MAIFWEFRVNKYFDKIRIKGTIKTGNNLEILLINVLFLISLAKELNGDLIPLVRIPRKTQKQKEFCYFKLKFKSKLDLFKFLMAVEKEFS